MTSTTKPRRYIAKCKTCACFTSALDLDNMRGAMTFGTKIPGAPVERPAVFIGRNGDHVIACRRCGAERSAKLVRGTFKPQHVCNVKCESSHGTICECSCGGKNHGASFSR